MQEGWNMFVTDHFVFISVPVDLSMHGLWCSALYALLSFLAANGILLGFRTDSSMYLSAFLPLKDPNLPKPAKRRRKELVQRSFQVLQHYLSFRNCMQNWRRPCDMRELLDLFWPFWAWQFSHLLAKMLNLEQRLYFVDLWEGTKIKGVPRTRKVLLALTWFSNAVTLSPFRVNDGSWTKPAFRRIVNRCKYW